MSRFSSRYKNLFILALLMIVSLFWGARAALAHSPHDVIDALDISPNYAQDKTVFIAVSAKGLLKSTDGGFNWKQLAKGLDNTGPLSSIVVSPSFEVDQTLFVATEGDGIYRSQDGGASWLKVNNGLANLRITLLSISADYASDKIVLAASGQGGLYKTNNGGDNWYPVIDNETQITAIAFSADQSQKLALIGDENGMLYLSTAEDERWQPCFQFSGGGAITSIAISPQVSKDKTWFVSTEKSGIFETVDGGASFVAVNKGLPAEPSLVTTGKNGIYKPSYQAIESLVMSPDYESDATLFASTWTAAVFQSNDRGNSWKLYNQGVTTDPQADSEQYKSPDFKNVSISKSFGQNRTIFLAGFDGLFKSTDGGYVWQQMETLPPRLIAALAISPGDKEDFTLAVATAGGGIYTTDKEGLIWAINNKGLNRADPMNIAFSPDYHSDNTFFFVSETDFGVSTNRGAKWNIAKFKRYQSPVFSIIRSGLRKLRLPIPRMLKPITPKPDMIAISPNFASDNTLYFGTRYDGVYRSVDRTLNWSPVWSKPQISSLVISPDFLSDRTLFAGVRDEGIYKTMDGGETWQLVNNGLSFKFADIGQPSATSLPLDLTSKNILLSISPDYKVDQTVFAGWAGGLFKTTDGGQSWQALAVSASGGPDHILALVISPAYEKDGLVMVSVKGRGLYKSIDRGLTFVEAGTDLINNNYQLKQIEFSPRYPIDQTIYGVSDEEVFQSTDASSHWKMLPRLIRYEDTREVIHYEGEWEVLEGNNFSTGSVTYSNVAYNKAALNFVGTGISWVGTKSNDQGMARVYIDGNYETTVDQFSESLQPMVDSCSITDLDYGLHNITVEVTGTKNPASSGQRITIDAFDILP